MEGFHFFFSGIFCGGYGWRNGRVQMVLRDISGCGFVYNEDGMKEFGKAQFFFN